MRGHAGDREGAQDLAFSFRILRACGFRRLVRGCSSSAFAEESRRYGLFKNPKERSCRLRPLGPRPEIDRLEEIQESTACSACEGLQAGCKVLVAPDLEASTRNNAVAFCHTRKLWSILCYA